MIDLKKYDNLTQYDTQQTSYFKLSSLADINRQCKTKKAIVAGNKEELT